MTSDRSAQRRRGSGIEVIDLHRTFVHEGGELHVLKGLNVRFEPGEMVSIRGRSGAGKSTFLHVLGTLDRPTRGRILFDGEDVFRYTSTRLANFRNSNIGFVFQFHHLLPEFTALENVMMPALIHRSSRSEAERNARELLDVVGLSKRLRHKPGELSGGEQQRVALARALVMEPRLLLADEPTGNLDGKTGQGIHNLFVELNQRLNLTIVIVTHDPRLARRMPRQLVMDAGKLVRPEDLTEHASPDVDEEGTGDMPDVIGTEEDAAASRRVEAADAPEVQDASDEASTEDEAPTEDEASTDDEAPTDDDETAEGVAR